LFAKIRTHRLCSLQRNKMVVSWERVAANFIVGFCTAFGAISIVDGVDKERLLYAGVLGGLAQGGLAAGKDMLYQTDGEKKKGQASPLLSVF